MGTSADSVYCRDLEGHIIAANASFSRKFGRDAAALAQIKASELVHPDDLPIFPQRRGRPRPPTAQQHHRTALVHPAWRALAHVD